MIYLYAFIIGLIQIVGKRRKLWMRINMGVNGGKMIGYNYVNLL